MSQISHIKYKDTIEAGRIDADFFKPEYLKIDETIEKQNYNELKGLIGKGNIFSGPFGSSLKSESYTNYGTPFIRISDIQDLFINKENLMYISEEDSERLNSTTLNIGDIVLSKIGTIGRLSLITSDLGKVNISENNIGLRLQNLSDKEKKVLLLFLLSKYGQEQIIRQGSGNVQLKINVSNIEELKIPNLQLFNIDKISKIYDDILYKHEQSKQLYREAEDLLLTELGLKNHTISHTLTFHTTKKAVDEAGRYDADYFQPKYDELIEKIENYKGGWEQLINLTTYINNGNQPPYSENGNIKFFSQKWIKDKGIDYSFLESTEEPMVESSFFDEEKNKPSLVSKGDILYYSVGANLGYCHTYLADEKIAVGSFINIIRTDTSKFDSIAMGVILNSMIGRMQADRDKSGVAQPYIYAKNLRKFKIPLINPQLQKEISDKIKESFKLRNESKELLEQAKKMVEDEIEKE